jgi:hypothetical protein
MLFVFERPVKSRVPLRCIKPTLRRQLDFAKLIILEKSGFERAGVETCGQANDGSGLHQKVGGWGSAGSSSEPRSGGLGNWGAPAACGPQPPRLSGTEVASFRKMDLSSQIESAIEFTIEGETPTRKSRSLTATGFDAPEGRAVLSHVDTTAVPGVVNGHKARLSAAASPSSRLVPVTPYCVQYILVLGFYSCVRRS